MLIRNVIHIIFKFFSIFVIFIGVGYGVSRFILSKKNDNSTKRKFLGLFMELDNFSILAIAINFIWGFFVAFCFFDFANINNLYLYTLLFLSVLFGIFSKSIKNLIIVFCSSGALYFAFYISRLLSNYLLEISFVWYVLLGNILLLLFICLYSIYFFIRNMNDVISRTKYIRRFRNEEN